MSKRKRFLSIPLLLILLLLPLIGATAESYELTYTGPGDMGYIVGEAQTAVLQLSDESGAVFSTYCIDQSAYVNEGVKYRRINLADSDYFAEDTADHIRAIVQKAYPFVTIAQLAADSGLDIATVADAVTAAQLAIWRCANGYTVEAPERIAALVDYFLGLDAVPATPPTVGDIEILPTFEMRSAGVRATFQYRVLGENADGSAIAASHQFSRDIAEDYGASVTLSENAPYRVVTVDGLPADATFEFTVSAEQTLSKDAYFYSPEGGRAASQSLVGVYEGKTPLSCSVSFSFQDPEGFTVRIKKLDSLTLVGLPGAVFEVCNLESFDESDPDCALYTLTTDDSGCASVAGLAEGLWYIREKTPPAGYIPYEGIFPVEVYQYTREQVYKNTAYGALEILKTDPDNNPLAGAAFSLFRGGAALGEPLMKDLVTDEAGLILIGELTPGEYTVLETAPAPGYHINDTPVAITVEPGAKATAAFVNERIQPGTLLLYKRDAITTEQLAGAVIGVFTDSAFENKLCEIITAKTEAVSVSELAPGTYYVKELSAPEGYLLDSSPQTVELIEGANVAVTFYNNEPPKTAGNYGLTLLIGGAALIATLTAALIFRKKLFSSGRS